jgi:very-short-patch-repair endonuclease
MSNKRRYTITEKVLMARALRRGVPLTEEAKNKISEGLKNSPAAKAWHEEMKSRPGKPHTEENRKKLGGILRKLNQSRRGVPLTEEHKNKIRGFEHTQGAKKKMSESNRASSKCAEQRARLHDLMRSIPGAFAHNKGRVFGEATREKMRVHLNGLFKANASFPERLVGARLENVGVNFIPQGRLPGSPHSYDFVLPENKVIIEEDGCYTHGCPIHQPISRENVLQWVEDSKNELHAIGLGYRVIRLWEHDVLAPKRPLTSYTIDMIKLVGKKDIKRARQFFR